MLKNEEVDFMVLGEHQTRIKNGRPYITFAAVEWKLLVAGTGNKGEKNGGLH